MSAALLISDMTVIAAIGTDLQERVVREASALSEAFDDELHVVRALERKEYSDEESADEETTILNVSRPEAEIREYAEQSAAEAADGIAGEYEAVGMVGNPARKLIRYADDQDARYVVIAGRKRTAVGKVLFGSVTQSVLLNATCPVVTIMPDDEE